MIKSWVCKDANGKCTSTALGLHTRFRPTLSTIRLIIFAITRHFERKSSYRFIGHGSRKYKLEIYRVGYKSNDAYSTYLAMGRPTQLTKAQVEQIKKQNDGSPGNRKHTNQKNQSL